MSDHGRNRQVQRRERAAHLYALLLRLYPRSHSQAFGDQMLRTFCDHYRDAVADVRLPWQVPLAPERRTPARVRRAFSQVLLQLGSPVCMPKPCGRRPGRPRGKRLPPAPCFPTVKLTP
jgi:hypothetical protein